MRHALTLSLVAAASLFALQAQAAEQTRSVAPFTTIANSGPVSVHIEVGKAQSVTVSGNDELVADLQTEVVDPIDSVSGLASCTYGPCPRSQP